MDLSASVRVLTERPYLCTVRYAWATPFLKPGDTVDAGLAALSEEVNLASVIERLDVLPLKAAQLRHPAAQEIAALHHHEVTTGGCR